MKKLGVLFMTILLCTACGSSSNGEVKLDEQPQIELVANEGAVVSTTFDETIKRIENDETFIVLLSSTYCGACLDFHIQSDDFTKEIGLTYGAIVLDDEPTNEQENLALANELFGHFSATPSIYLIQDGEVKDSLTADQEHVNLENYTQFLKDNQIIE